MHKKVRLGFQGCADTWVNSSLGIVLVSAVAGVDKSLLAAIYDGKQDWGRVNPVFFKLVLWPVLQLVYFCMCSRYLVLISQEVNIWFWQCTGQ